MTPPIGFTVKRVALAAVAVGILITLTPLPTSSGIMRGPSATLPTQVHPTPDPAFSVGMQSHSILTEPTRLPLMPAAVGTAAPPLLPPVGAASPAPEQTRTQTAAPDERFTLDVRLPPAFETHSQPIIVAGAPEPLSHVDALMRTAYRWQIAAEQAFAANYHVASAVTTIEAVRAERDAALQQVQTLTQRVQALEATSRSVEVQAATQAVPQPPPLIETTPPPLPTPTVAANPQAQVTAPAAPVDPTPHLTALVSRNLQPRPAAELREEDQHTVSADSATQLTLQGPYSAVTHQLDSHGGALLSTSIAVQSQVVDEVLSDLHNALEVSLGPAALRSEISTTYYGPGVDVTVTPTAESLMISIVHTGLAAGPIHVYDAPPEEDVEPPPLVTRYD